MQRKGHVMLTSPFNKKLKIFFLQDHGEIILGYHIIIRVHKTNTYLHTPSFINLLARNLFFYRNNIYKELFETQ